MRSLLAFTRVALVLLVSGLGGLKSAAADASPGGAPTAEAPETNAQDVLRSYVQLQEQVHAAQLAIDQTRKENAEAAARSAQEVAARLQSLENGLSNQRARELEAMQSSNRVMLIMAGTFAVAGVAAMLLMAFFQWRTVHGLASVAAGLPSVRALGAGSPVAALGTGDLPPGGPGQVEQSNARLIGALDRIEQRIFQLEHVRRPALPEGDPAPIAGDARVPRSNGDGGPAGPHSPGSGLEANPEADGRYQIKQLLGAGQALLDQDKPEGALTRFEEALAIDPRHGEALVKKGAALERLQKLDEAIVCYDQAIAADGSLTVAYLHKGGLFNRMEKFAEALECYELALRTQEKRTG
ncbi:MAG TPA: tetratricopeptide repeat protein [Verrucomicrobiae bacterium]